MMRPPRLAFSSSDIPIQPSLVVEPGNGLEAALPLYLRAVEDRRIGANARHLEKTDRCRLYSKRRGKNVVQNLTNDHDHAAKALRSPLGNADVSASSYLPVVDLIKRWPEGPVCFQLLRNAL